jgi:phage gp29-like protein
MTQRKKKQIRQGGMLTKPGEQMPDIILQMPEVFMFDMRKYMNSVEAAEGIDFSDRVRLYDMYRSARLDLHLSGVIAKRMRGVTNIPIEFQRNGKPDEAVNRQLRSPWFKELRKDIIMSEFWGFSLMQFYTDTDGNIRYDLIDRKHYDPVHHKLLKFQGDQDGIDIDAFPDMLFVGKERDLGIYVELLIAVLYKRGDMSDWAQFCNIFGMPIREYTYDAGDNEARLRTIQDARRQGSAAVYIHPEGSKLNFVESGNKTGSSDLYKSFADYWDAKISIRVLGNTLTTDAKKTGTQALGVVHKEEEDEMRQDDRDTILDVLNYDMKPIFSDLGFNVDRGEFVYAKKEHVDPSKQIDIVSKLNDMGLPLDDDYLYDTFSVEKPKDYDAKKLQKEDEKQQKLVAAQQALHQSDDDKEGDGKFRNRLMSFFGIAPHEPGADNDF